MAIEKEAILLMMRLLAIDLEYTLLLTTLNIRCTFLAAENSQTKEQYHVGTITYNTVLQNGCLRYLREINSLWQLDLVLIQQGSMTRQEQVYGKKTSRSCYR
jgi:hypothetical protein